MRRRLSEDHIEQTTEQMKGKTPGVMDRGNPTPDEEDSAGCGIGIADELSSVGTPKGKIQTVEKKKWSRSALQKVTRVAWM